MRCQEMPSLEMLLSLTGGDREEFFAFLQSLDVLEYKALDVLENQSLDVLEN